MFLQVQDQALVPAAAFMEMAVGTAHKLLSAELPSNTGSSILSSAVLPAPMIISATAAVMDCQLVQRAAAIELAVQSTTVHFRACVLQAPYCTKHHLSPEGEL